ncbi:unnamed protein product [Calypogeia fissa]
MVGNTRSPSEDMETVPNPIRLAARTTDNQLKALVRFFISIFRCNCCNWWPGNLSSKRVRSWESCDDVEELKKMLTEKEDELTKKEKQVAELQRKLKSGKKQTSSSPAGGEADPITPSKSKKTLAAHVSQLKKSIQSQVSNQMVYKPSTKHGTARLVPVELFDITESVIEALVGEELFEKASSGPKQAKLVLSNEDLESLYGWGSFSKGLRYGAALVLSDGLKFVLSKADGVLKISGTYKMVK